MTPRNGSEQTDITSRLNPEFKASIKASDTVGADGEMDESALKALQKQQLHQQIVAWVKAEYQKCKDQMEPIKRQWYLNMAFYKGDQYVDYVNNRLIKIPSPNGRVRLVVNRIRPMARTELSRLTSQEPTAEVVPASTEESDILAAEAAQSVFLSLRERHKLQKIFTSASWWAVVTGNGYVKTAWKKDYEYENPDNSVVLGDICYTAVSPFHVMVPELLTEDIEDQPYVFNVFTKPIEWVKARYGDILPEDMAPTIVGKQEILEEQYLNARGSSQNAKPDSSLIIEAWVKPGSVSFMPKGGLVTIVDSYVVQASLEGIPYEHGEYPFTHIVSVPSGSYYGTSSIDDLIPLQREYNRSRSQQVEARNLMSKPGLMYRSGSLNPAKYTTAPGQMIDIKPGADWPVPLPLPQMPAYLRDERQEMLTDIEDISGQHQVSKGNTPSGVTAATAIQFLQEQDNSYMATTFLSVEEAFKKLAKQTIMLFIQYADSERMIKVVGRDGQISSKMLQGSDIKNGTDVRVESGSSLPVSKAARIALFTDWIGRGIIDPQQGMELMKLPNMQSYWDIVKVDENQAQRENIRMSEMAVETIQQGREMAEMMKAKDIEDITMLTGNEPTDIMLSQLEEVYESSITTVNDYDEHEKHIEIHNRYRKSQAYEMLPEEVKDEFDRHVKRHESKLQAKMMQKFVMQGMVDGGGEGGPVEAGSEEMPPGEEGNNAEGENQFSGIEQEEPVDGAPVTE